jgi:hypothetical protein
VKGQAIDVIPMVSSLVTALVVLTVVVGTFSTGTTAFAKSAVLGIQADRLTNSALLAQSEDLKIRSQMSGYNISYRPSSSNMVFTYKGRKVRNNVERLEGAFDRIEAPLESKKINAFVCIENKNNVLYMTVDRCPS